MQSNEIIKCILSRTSVRRFTQAPVSPVQIDTILHAAMSAPTGVNRQPWEYYVIQNKEILKKLAAALPYAKMVANAPVAILVCGDTSRFLDGEDSTLWVQDLSASSENILLAAHALGLGGVWTCIYPHADRMEAAREILSIPNSLVPFNLIPIGQPMTEGNPMKKYTSAKIHTI